jgi:hypothetical protein
MTVMTATPPRNHSDEPREHQEQGRHEMQQSRRNPENGTDREAKLSGLFD